VTLVWSLKMSINLPKKVETNRFVGCCYPLKYNLLYGQ
ncbi:MAG: hypothetical protein ACJARN_000198, partial [Arenicella sp.]